VAPVDDVSMRLARSHAVRSLRLALSQGLTLVHFSAQRKGFREDRGWVCRGCLRGVREVFEGIRGCSGYILCQKRLRLS